MKEGGRVGGWVGARSARRETYGWVAARGEQQQQSSSSERRAGGVYCVLLLCYCSGAALVGRTG